MSPAKNTAKPGAAKPTPADGHDAGVHTDWREAALTPIALAILALALVQAITPSSPDVYWDVDPRAQIADRGRLILTSITPAMLAILQLLMMLLSVVGLWLHSRVRKTRFRFVDGPSISDPNSHVGVHVHDSYLEYSRPNLSFTCAALSLLGIGFAAYHVSHGGPNVQPGSQWIAAAAGALALFHLSQHERVRRWLLASLMAMLLPLSIKAFNYVYLEHAETLRMFMADKEKFLAQRGWTEDSPNAQIFIRRMSDPEAAGAYGLSNVFGSIVAALTAMVGAVAAGMVLHAAKGRDSSSRAAALILCLIAAGGFFTVYLSRSKGAFAALLIACVGMVLWWIWGMLVTRSASRPAAPTAGRRGWLVAAMSVFVVLAAAGAIVARGYLPPPPATGGGERSLFFRSQYFDAAWRYATTSPPEVVFKGVGPAGFQTVYQRVKDPLNPEEVMSTHNVLIDFAAMLGAGGIAWGCLLMLWLACSARGAGLVMSEARGVLERPPERGPVAQRELLGAVLLTAAIFIFQNRVQIDMFTPLGAGTWLLCMGAFGLLTTLLASEKGWLARAGACWVMLAAFSGALVLLVHGQIEMTFFSTGGSVLAWLMVAVAGGAGVAVVRERRVISVGVKTHEATELPGVPFFAHVVLVVGLLAAGAFAAMPMSRTMKVQAQLADASARLRAGDLPGAIAALDKAKTLDPADADVWRSWSTQRWELSEALRQVGRVAEANALMLDNLRVLQQAVSPSGPLPNEGKLLRGMAEQLERVETGRPEAERLAQASEVRARLVELNPHSIEDWQRHAALFDRRGLKREALDAYRQTMKVNEQAYLDPAKQLGDADRAAVEKRIVELSGK